MGALSSSGVRVAAVVALGAGFAVAAPMACIFPSYTYDLPPGAGGSVASASHATSGSTMVATSGVGGMAVSSSTGNTGGSTAMSSSSSTGGPPCASKDCSDPTCMKSFKCVPTVPPAGTAYFSLYDGVASQFPGCDGEFPMMKYEGNNQIMVLPAACNCTCGAPQGETCEITGNVVTGQNIVVGGTDGISVIDGPCGGASQCYGPLLELPTWSGACEGPNYFQAGVNKCGPLGDCTPTGNGTAPCNQAVRVNQLKVTGGSCTASPQPPTIPPVAWGTLGEACTGATPGKGCADMSDSCMPIPQGLFHAGLCIMQAGDVGCSGQFSEKHLFYGGSMDTRSCSACACGASSGGTCSATVTVSLDTGGNACGAPNVTLKPTTQAGDCMNIAGNPNVGSRKAMFTAPMGGACAGTAQPMGTAMAINPTTFCCIPAM